MREHIRFTREPSLQERLSLAEAALSNLINCLLSDHALMIEKGYFTHEESERMLRIVRSTRAKMGQSFDLTTALAAMRAAFKIELRNEDV